MKLYLKGWNCLKIAWSFSSCWLFSEMLMKFLDIHVWHPSYSNIFHFTSTIAMHETDYLGFVVFMFAYGYFFAIIVCNEHILEPEGISSKGVYLIQKISQWIHWDNGICGSEVQCNLQCTKSTQEMYSIPSKYAEYANKYTIRLFLHLTQCTCHTCTARTLCKV